MVPALAILALWAALLGPSVVRWLREHRPSTSIASFHRQLRLLEVSGPKLVAPANRLGGASASMDHEKPRRQREQPHLVLLGTGTNDKEHDMPYDGRDEDDFDTGARRARHRARAPREVVEDPFEYEWEDEVAYVAPRRPAPRSRTVRAPIDDEFDERIERPAPRRALHAATPAPQRARSRRVRILMGLSAAVVATFLLGLLPGLTLVWALTVLSVVALAGYLALMYYASNTGLYGAPEERGRPVARTVLPAYADEDVYGDDFDDEDWGEPRVAAAR